MTDKTEIEQVRRAYEHYKECCNRLPLDVEATKALQEKLERLENGGWLPIESAPIDGTFILCGIPNFLPSLVHWGTYFGKAKWGHNPETFMTEAEFKEYWIECDYEPTHWQPLPPAPKQGEK